MKDDNIYKEWMKFTKDEQYQKYFLSKEDDWKEKLQSIKDYINNNNKRPSNKDKDEKTKKLGQWLSNQVQNANKRKHIMKDDNIYKEWMNFINDEQYKKYFK